MCRLSNLALFCLSTIRLGHTSHFSLLHTRSSNKKVFKGLNESTGELFAVKQISLTRGLKEEINTLEAEIDLMKDLDHRCYW